MNVALVQCKTSSREQIMIMFWKHHFLAKAPPKVKFILAKFSPGQPVRACHMLQHEGSAECDLQCCNTQCNLQYGAFWCNSQNKGIPVCETQVAQFGDWGKVVTSTKALGAPHSEMPAFSSYSVLHSSCRLAVHAIVCIPALYTNILLEPPALKQTRDQVVLCSAVLVKT